jgi:cell division protein FtsB
MDIGVMIRKRKMIIITIIAIIAISIATTATIILLKSNNKTKSSNTGVPATNKSISTLRAEAETARKANNKTEAKILLTQAQQKIAEQPKSDSNTNSQVDVQAQLYLLDHSGTSK